MDTTNQDGADWQTQEQVDACLAENNVSHDQMRRWRREGLLPNVEQVPTAFRGSVVHYPAGTCEQIAAAARFFREKHSVDYVGRMLWWEGVPVGERFWKSDLIHLAGLVDRFRGLIARLMNRLGENSRTLPERVSDAKPSNIIVSRVRPRLDDEEYQSVLRAVFDTASGRFDGFEPPERDGRGNEHSFDKAAIIKGFDIAASEGDFVFGHNLRLTDEIEPTLKALARAMRDGSFSEIAVGPTEVIFAARDDVRNALRMGLAHYEACEWIYGRQAFGLRLMAWIAKKHPTKTVGAMILGFALLRRSSNHLLPSEEIRRLADQAERERDYSLKLKYLWQNDARFRDVFAPKRLRNAFADEPSMKRHLDNVAAARDTQLGESSPS